MRISIGVITSDVAVEHLAILLATLGPEVQDAGETSSYACLRAPNETCRYYRFQRKKCNMTSRARQGRMTAWITLGQSSGVRW